MLAYAVKRLLRSVLTLFLVVTLVFLLMRRLPLEGIFGARFDKLAAVQRQAMLGKMGLLAPWYTQLGAFYRNLAHGNLGVSTVYRVDVPVTAILAPRIPYSVGLGLAATVLALAAGSAMGIHMAGQKSRFWDHLWSGCVMTLCAIPMAAGLPFLQLYAGTLLKLPILFDRHQPESWILPTASLALAGAAGHALWLRRFLVDELNKDYVKLARAKGMSHTAILLKHALGNACVPMAQFLPTAVLATLAGSIYTESLYSIPGMGGLLVDALQRQDHPLVQALVLLYSAAAIAGMFLGDLLMALIDPRIRQGRNAGTR